MINLFFDKNSKIIKKTFKKTHIILEHLAYT